MDGVVRVEIEMNMNWAEKNPELFVAKCNEFSCKYHFSKWKHEIDLSRDRFVTLIAKRRE
jgi:hypothetical protein